MEIKSKKSLDLRIPVRSTTGEREYKDLKIAPGKHNYPEISNKEPSVVEQLRLYRKHEWIDFAELLPSDVEELKKIEGTPGERAVKLKDKNTLNKPRPIASVKTPKLEEGSPRRVLSKGRSKVVKGTWNVTRPGENENGAQGAGKDNGKGKGGRKVSDKS